MRKGDYVRVNNPDTLAHGMTGVVTGKWHGLIRVRLGEHRSMVNLFNPEDLVPAHMSLNAIIGGDDRPAPNGDEFEEYMLRKLARQDEREG